MIYEVKDGAVGHSTPDYAWRLSGPDRPRALLLCANGRPISDPPRRIHYGQAVRLPRRRLALRLLPLLDNAHGLGAEHGPCPNRTVLGTMMTPCPSPVPHSWFALSPHGDLYVKTGDASLNTEGPRVCLITRDQAPRRTMVDLVHALQTSYHLGAGQRFA